ncbi:hypothetical protein N7519_003235 [Penicillium mononematosum]|uniref:uncharacterized protein n=1 Tax=Penicillium mononematosum TaxID=268346 RepID=UPI002546F611|nr:uncharacterized protein N7519_003235 [Penicillium mononematosum]KAJ6188327.1 hypothetical protein N7519_003235 [Penicillium mononematosum]
MKYCGVVYDVGLKFGDDGFSVEPLDPALVEYDMRTIAKDMHANAVRIEGRRYIDWQLLHGLLIRWDSRCVDGTCAYFEEAAKAAERLRNEGVDVIFVAGCEYTIFSKGVFPGESFNERAMWLGSQYPDGRMSEDIPQTLREKSVELNKVLRSFATVVRAKFNGPLTYSAGTWELADWDIFDIVGIDYYRRGETKEQYVAGLERHRFDKPLVVMEVGCCAYEGAADRGDGGFMLLKSTNPDGSGVFEGDVIPTRSEREQADYLNTQLSLLATADVHAVFVYVFSFPCMRRGEGASDLDMMCFSLVKYYPEQDPRSNAMPPWSPKESFHQVADFFRSMLQPQI